MTTDKRSPYLPNLPTIQEAAEIPLFVADAWNGFCAPARTPATVITRLHREITGIIRLPDVEKRLAALGNTIVGSTPEAFGAFMRAEREKWGKYAATLGAIPQ